MDEGMLEKGCVVVVVVVMQRMNHDAYPDRQRAIPSHCVRCSAR